MAYIGYLFYPFLSYNFRRLCERKCSFLICELLRNWLLMKTKWKELTLFKFYATMTLLGNTSRLKSTVGANWKELA
jgi:hypothetical protein